jgi:uncharacterized membrane protein
MESELSRQSHAALQRQGEREYRSRYMTRAEPVGGARSGRERRATALGWFSLGLGVAQLIAPQNVARLIGVRDSSRTRILLRAVGLREIACGIGLLSNPHAPAWAWARVAGDLVDVALLGSAMGASKSAAGRTMAAAASVLAISAADAQTARDLDRSRHGGHSKRRGSHVSKAITINRAPDEVYRFWRDFENLPSFMAHLKSVQSVNGRSHWQAKGPLGTTIEWDADVVEDRPSELITWRSVAGADVNNRGSVRFRPAPGGRGTEVIVELTYEPPAGSLGVAAAKLLGEEPAQQIAGDLRRLKQVLETGEVMHSDASIHRGMHAARPSRKFEPQTKQVTK